MWLFRLCDDTFLCSRLLLCRSFWECSLFRSWSSFIIRVMQVGIMWNLTGEESLWDYIAIAYSKLIYRYCYYYYSASPLIYVHFDLHYPLLRHLPITTFLHSYTQSSYNDVFPHWKFHWVYQLNYFPFNWWRSCWNLGQRVTRIWWIFIFITSWKI